MDYFNDIIDSHLNSESNTFDEEDDVLKVHFKNYKDIINNASSIENLEYTYSSNDDDEKIPDIIVSEFEATMHKQYASSDNNNIISKETRKQHHITPLDISSKNSTKPIQRQNWEIVSLVDKIKTGTNAAMYISIQKYSNNYYVVFTKTSSKRKTKNFSLPISVAKFIADNLQEAFKNKNKSYIPIATSRSQWYLCKEYGTIYPHPKNHITITHQTCKSQDYIVLIKYDSHNKQKNFAFSISYSKELSTALKKAYRKGKKFANKIYAVTYPNKCNEMNSTQVHHPSNILNCVCGRKPEINKLHCDFYDRPGRWYINFYCPHCNIYSETSTDDNEQAIHYWNEMISTLINNQTDKD